MNSPIPSLLLPLRQNESLCETIGMKICHQLYGHSHENQVIFMRLARFPQALVLQRETQTLEVKVCICTKLPIRPALINKKNLSSSRGLFTMSDYKALDINIEARVSGGRGGLPYEADGDARHLA